MITHAASRKQYTVLLDHRERVLFFSVILSFVIIRNKRKNDIILLIQISYV